MLAQLVAGRRAGEPILDLLKRSVHELAGTRHPFIRFTRVVVSFWRTVEGSAALEAYVREMRAGAEVAIAELIAKEIGGPHIDAIARLLAGIVVTGWQTAYGEAMRRQRAGVLRKRSQARLSRDHRSCVRRGRRRCCAYSLRARAGIAEANVIAKSAHFMQQLRWAVFPLAALVARLLRE